MTASLPDYDHERVYVSDIKKLAQWYNILHKAGYITLESFVKAEETTDEESSLEDSLETKKAAPKKEKTTTPKVKASTSSAKGTPKSTHRKMG
jgi:hypothetical protein